MAGREENCKGRGNQNSSGFGAKRRLRKEYQQFSTNPPKGLSLTETTEEAEDLSMWQISVDGPKGTVYEDEKFVLQFKFGGNYPFDPPEVTFVGEHIPIHHHVYSNGHICLSILTDDWSPALSAEAVCLSVTSMLSSAKEKKRPPDDAFYVRTCSSNPKKTKWWYHDDNV